MKLNLFRPFQIAALGAILCALPGAAQSPNPPAPGFDGSGSDPRAVEIADRVMSAMGGREAWNATRHVRWRFFGRRLHVWDRQTNDIRIEGTDGESGEPYVILMNLSSGEGRAWRNGVEIEEPESLAEMLDLGESLWINDSYWVFMPYKLKDTGVTLRHLGTGELGDGRTAEVLELTFTAVGRTPENKYHVYVATDTDLVEQWDFFADATDAEPRFSTPWGNWRRYGAILLSDDRGERDHTEIAVYEHLPGTVYTSPEAVAWSALP